MQHQQKILPRESSRAEKNQQIQHALSPFEDDLIFHLPTPKQIIEASLLRKEKHKQKLKKLFTIAIFGVLGSIVYIDPRYKKEVLVSNVGQRSVVNLYDGSQVHLNTNTKLDVSYHLFSRRIVLQQGEATFHVKHNRWHAVMPWFERSFNVYIDDVRVQDIGTVFNIRQYDSKDVQVAVLEGEVKVYKHDQQALSLIEGQSLMIKKGKYTNIEKMDVDELIAWHKGYLYFNDQAVSRVIDDLNRYGQLPIKIEDQSVAELRISGQVDLNNRMQFINALPTFAPVQLRYINHDEIKINKK